jgi:hypothetical protein
LNIGQQHSFRQQREGRALAKLKWFAIGYLCMSLAYGTWVFSFGEPILIDIVEGLQWPIVLLEVVAVLLGIDV